MGIVDMNELVFFDVDLFEVRLCLLGEMFVKVLKWDFDDC